MTDLKPFIDALKAAFNDDKGFLDSNYTDIGDDDASRVVLDGEWDFATIAYTLYEEGLLAPSARARRSVCGCAHCHTGPFPIMHVCADCGGKRCPRAAFHDSPCGGSADQ